MVIKNHKEMVEALRAASAYWQLHGTEQYFPPPIKKLLSEYGHLSNKRVSDTIHYIADILEE